MLDQQYRKRGPTPLSKMPDELLVDLAKEATDNAKWLRVMADEQMRFAKRCAKALQRRKGVS